MKRITTLTLVLALLLSLCACGGSSSANGTDAPVDNTEAPAEETEIDTNEIQAVIGQTVTTDIAEVTLDRFEFDTRVYYAHEENADKNLLPFTPELEEEMQDVRNVWINADSGEVFATFTLTVKNITKASLTRTLWVKVHYDDGNTFDSDTDNAEFFDTKDYRIILDSYIELTTAKGHAVIDMDALEQAHVYNGYIKVPTEVSTNENTPLSIELIFSTKGSTQSVFYKIR